MPQFPSGGGSITPLMSLLPWLRMSIIVLRSIASAMARRIFGLLNGAALGLMMRLLETYWRRHVAHRLGRLRSHVLQQRIDTSATKVRSNSSAMKARMRVERFSITRHSIASR